MVNNAKKKQVTDFECLARGLKLHCDFMIPLCSDKTKGENKDKAAKAE